MSTTSAVNRTGVSGAQPKDMWDLVDAAQAGDGTSFCRLYTNNVAAVFSFVLARTLDETLAEDLTSETFFRAYKAIRSISYRGRSFRGWLLTIARNLVLDEVGSARRRYEAPQPKHYDPPAIAADPATAVCDRMRFADIRRWVDHLPTDQRDCLRLRFFEQRSVAEVAGLLCRSQGSVRALQFRAIKRLAHSVPAQLATV